mgnify:CR=1 FL=1
MRHRIKGLTVTEFMVLIVIAHMISAFVILKLI